MNRGHLVNKLIIYIKKNQIKIHKSYNNILESLMRSNHYYTIANRFNRTATIKIMNFLFINKDALNENR